MAATRHAGATGRRFVATMRRRFGRKVMRIRFIRLAAAWLLACALPSLAAAQSWPQKPIKMIIPYPAGGGTDFIGRLAAKHLSDRLGQQIFVENRGGANGAIGLQALSQADPDGYTIATSSDTPLVVNPWLYDKLPYQPLRDFIPVATLVRFPGMLAVHPSLPAKSVAELIALAKSKPGDLAYASAGVGNFSHLAMELFSLATGVAAPQRMPALPDIPAVAETVPGFNMAPWIGIIVPARTPQEIVARLSQETLAVMRDGEVVKLLTEQQVTPMATGSQEFEALIKQDLDKWAKVVKTAGIKGE